METMVLKMGRKSYAAGLPKRKGYAVSNLRGTIIMKHGVQDNKIHNIVADSIETDDNSRRDGHATNNLSPYPVWKCCEWRTPPTKHMGGVLDV